MDPGHHAQTSQDKAAAISVWTGEAVTHEGPEKTRSAQHPKDSPR
jgi:hypothetical protein